ncbi:MAG: hypothetical protein KGH54_00555 [Candidatus Micrarchaeota archaeon]|nr:hypothetical protein [Candidatus Micrarchaeota archaeon]
MEMFQNSHSCRPPGPSTKALIDTFFAHRVLKTLSQSNPLSDEDVEVLGRALHKVNLIFQGKKLVEGLSSVFRGHEPISEYRRALKVLEDKKFRIKSREQLTERLAAVHDELETAIKTRKTTPAAKNAIQFFRGVEEHASNADY